MSSPITHLYGYRAEVILADEDGKTFVVNGALKYGSDGKAQVDIERVRSAIDAREERRYPLFREVKLTDA